MIKLSIDRKELDLVLRLKTRNAMSDNNEEFKLLAKTTMYTHLNFGCWSVAEY